MIISKKLETSSAQVIVEITTGSKNSMVCFVGHHPSTEMLSVIDTIIRLGYCQIMVVTNALEQGCNCGQNCACKKLQEKLPVDSIFLFDEVQHPDLVKILPKLGADTIWVINADHSQKDEIIQWISS